MNQNKKDVTGQKAGSVGCMSVILLIIIIGVVSSLIPKGDKGAVKLEPIQAPEYDIIRVEDLSLGKFIRMNYLISVNDSYSVEDLKTIAKSIVESEKSKQPTSTVSVVIFSNNDDPSTGVNSIGDIEWGPYGEWAKAMDVEPGDYSKHEYTYNFRKEYLNKEK
ncbi:hypothetical protein [Anaerovorax sp. IOR16]|uniref:hypothetical protein n=1 Tax=Anaerovorax sp. IOR16 TaxID=2773458 RepID=UPI0019CF5537|nr:hypothetical protein [Anaerovorax sp. IOR16]